MTGQRRRTTRAAKRPYPSCSRAKKPDFCSALAVRFRNNQTDSTGTSVLERTYEAIIENETARASGGNSARPTPTMKNEGMKTAITHSIASKRGRMTSRMAATTARLASGVVSRWRWMFSIATVASSTRIPIASARPPSAQEQEDHQGGEDRAEEALGDQSRDRALDVDRLVEGEIDVDVLGHDRAHLRQHRLQGIDHVERRSVGALGDRQVDGPPAVDEGDVVDDVGAVLDPRDVAQVDRRSRAGPQGDALEVGRLLYHGVRLRDGGEVADANVAGGERQVLAGERGSDLVGSDAV